MSNHHRIFGIVPRLLALAALPLLMAGFLQSPQASAAETKRIRVTVWDERQPAQKQAYTNFLGNQIADHLKTVEGLTVKSVGLDDPGQGLDGLEDCDVLVWWGHVRHGEISPEKAQEIVKRVQSGKLSLLSLHSAHWSQPFVEAMHQIARDKALAALSPEERATAKLTETNLFANFRSVPKYNSLRTPSVIYRKPIAGPVEVQLTLPNCCFPAYRADGKPSEIRVLQAKHPIAQGLPATFAIAQTEMYDETFHVPEPDVVVLEERWATGEWFRSGSLWNLGQGRVFYFRPGHETYPVFKNAQVLKVMENAVRFLGTQAK